MHKTVITDASCFIILHKIEKLDLLQKVYGSVSTTPEVALEFAEPLPDWVTVDFVLDRKYVEFLETLVDKGEASALALAKEVESPFLIIDDLKARRLATKLNLKYTGTLGVIHKSKQMGVIEKIKPVLDLLLATNFRIADRILEELLLRNNE
jgi:predicted nucleic acid-binding protein